MRIFILAFFGFFCFQEMSAQMVQSYNYNSYKHRPYYFGIALGYSTSNFKISHSRDFIKNENYRLTQAINGPGFQIGVVGNLKFGEYFDFRTIPTFLFTERTIQYSNTGSSINDPTRRESLESVFFEMPFLLRFKSHPYKDRRVFVIAGIKYSYDLQNNSRTRQAENIIQISPHDYMAEVGFGMQIFLPYFILSPQITFSHGLSNILIANRSLAEASVLEKILSRTISFSLLFEG